MKPPPPKQASTPASPDSASVESRSVVSLATMFYLVTIGAVFSACLRLLFIDDGPTAEAYAKVAMVGVVLGTSVGSICCGFYYQQARQGMLGALVGGCLGAVYGLVSLIPIALFYELYLTAFAGCWLLIVLMLGMARFQK